MHREPILDEPDLERFIQTVEPLMRSGRDIMWILAGRTDSNLPKLTKLLNQHKLNYEVFHLCYNTKQMAAYGHWKRQRGLANSRSIEQLFYVYKGHMPKTAPKKRMHVDPGSPLFNQVVRNVPVLAPKHQALVTREVRLTSLSTMVGIPQEEDPGEKQKAQRMADSGLNQPDGAGGSDQLNQPGLATKAMVASCVKKRKLYRQLSGAEVPWFPHDNDMDLLKELCWEAGQPRWVLFGTPSGGAGIHGCLESGTSVVALCFDDHHRTHLMRFLKERAVEAMVTGTTLVFKDETLRQRSIALDLCKEDKGTEDPKKEKEKGKEKEKKTEKGKEKEKEKAKKGNTPEKKETPKKPKKKTKEETPKAKDSAESSSSSQESSNSSSSSKEPAPKKPKKG